MPGTQSPFTRVQNKFIYYGMNVHNPPDSLPDDRCPFLFNLQPDLLQNALTTRPPIVSLATTAAGVPIHSLCRMNDSVPGATEPFSRFAGAGSSLYSGVGGALAALDTGFSGNPLAMVPYRPSQAAEPWLYVYDSMRQQRYKTDNSTKQNIGIQAPTDAPGLVWNQPFYDIVENAQSTGNWNGGTTSGGTTSAATLVARVPAGCTALSVIYERAGGAPSLASIAVASSSGDFSWLTAGSMVTIDSEQVVIEQTFPGGYNTTVLAAQNDPGGAYCTVVPAIPIPGLAKNMTVSIGGTYYRVLSVTAGPGATYSFRVVIGPSAGDAITAPPSFWAWTTASHTAGAALTGNAINFTFTPSNPANGMQDIVATNPQLATPLNLSFAGNRPLQNEDYLHISLAFDNPALITEIHILLAMNATTLFADDYFYYVLVPSDFQSSITSGVAGNTTEQANIQSQLDALTSSIAGSGVSGFPTVTQPPYPIPEVPSSAAPASTQMNLGTSAKAWTELMVKIGDLTRVGNDQALSLANVVKLGIFVNTAGVTVAGETGVVNMYFGGWWVGGGYGPDCNFNTYGNQAPEIQWRYRYRNSLTGAHSTVSPETRNGEILRRQSVTLAAPNSPDAQVDTVDWERRGGTNPDWHYVGSVPQGTDFIDTTTEAAAQIADPLEVTSYQPWPVTDIPRSGTATITGTSVVWASGDTFNRRWLRGGEIIIGGNTYSFYAPPNTTTYLELEQTVSSAPGVYEFSIPEATIEGAPLYAGWLDEANNRICAVGDPLNPGFMYFSNPDNPDGASDNGYTEITSPSEPLLNGFYQEGSNYVFTNSSLYRVESTPGAVNPYVAYRLSGVEGMAGPWAFDASRRMVWYYGPDGIYAYAFGPAADNITAKDLFPLFPHEGQLGRAGIPGVPVSIGGHTIYPPDYSLPNQLRIGYSESFVYATYQNSNGDTEALVYSLTLKGWRKDLYSPQATLFVLEKGIPNPLLMVGGVDGNVYNVGASGTNDAGGPIAWVCLTRAADAGDSRAVKQWGDEMLDYSGTFSWTVLWDNLLVTGASQVVPPEAQRAHVIMDLFAPPDTDDTQLIHYNMANLLVGVGCPVYLYEWQPSFLPLPEITTSRVTDWQTGGALHYKFVQGIRIHANTFGVDKVFQVQYDGYQLGPVLTINHQGEQTLPYSWPLPFKCHMMRLVPIDDVPWDLFSDSEWVFEIEPEPANYWICQPTALGQSGYLHCREMWLSFAVPAAGAVVSVILDNGTPLTLATLPASAAPSKQYLVMPPLKGRYWQLTASGTGLQIYENDLEFSVKSWGSNGPYQRVKPFGDISGGAGRSGARI